MRKVAESNGVQRRILFVDDEPAVLDGFARILRPVPEGWTIEFVSDPHEALHRVRAQPFHVVVSDMRMPGLDGTELLGRVREVSPDSVRLMLTGQADLATAVAAVNQGHVFQLLHKPCERDRLVACLKRAVQQADLQVAERNLLRSQLEHAQKMAVVGEFTAGIVHDVNNILSGISGLSRSDSTIDHQCARTMINESAHRAAALTRELMSFSRRDEDQPMGPLDLPEVVHACTGLLISMLECRVVLRTAVPVALPRVWGHSGRLKQVITNLVINARDATPDDGEIALTARERTVDAVEAADRPGWRAGRFVCLAVADTGCGMDEPTRRRLFEPFFTTKAAGQGTGLGLSLVQRLIAQHQGWIDVESTPGAGSTFRVFLPVAREEGTEATP